jgi:hypothetical protein
MTIFLYTQQAKCTGISYIDFTSIKVCFKGRAKHNKVFNGMLAGGSRLLIGFMVLNWDGEN